MLPYVQFKLFCYQRYFLSFMHTLFKSDKDIITIVITIEHFKNLIRFRPNSLVYSISSHIP